MNETIDTADMAILKRAAARDYIRRRHMLRLAVRAGLPAEVVREVKRQVNNHRSVWTMLRRELQP